MDRQDITELHYITPRTNLRSIGARGILCHARAAEVEHVSVASAKVQSRRANRRIPGGHRLHEYVNLYFNARNAMLFKIIKNYNISDRIAPEDLTILRISPDVLDFPGTVVTDINAAADIEPRWHTVDEGLPLLDQEEIHAEYWDGRRHMQRMMAEVLVPHAVEPESVTSAYVVSDEVAEVVSRGAPTLATEVKPYMFFRGGRS